MTQTSNDHFLGWGLRPQEGKLQVQGLPGPQCDFKASIDNLVRLNLRMKEWEEGDGYRLVAYYLSNIGPEFSTVRKIKRNKKLDELKKYYLKNI